MGDSEFHLEKLDGEIAGELFTDLTSRRLYATDASPLEQIPLGVVRPRQVSDCVKIMQHAAREGIPLILRGAGTSLAGQCVGPGLVVDMSRYLDQIVDIDVRRQLARVQPGVVLADLNDALHQSGLMFAPDPSTGNRCTIGGMVGNNAWGMHAIRCGTTRDHVEAMEAVLSDASVVRLGPLDDDAREAKLHLESLEGEIYRTVSLILNNNLDAIHRCYPSVRGIPNNAGYALDVLAAQQPWDPKGQPFNLAPFLCGSEGTLALVTELTLRLQAIPAQSVVICAHFDHLDEALQGVDVAMAASPSAVELLDRHILGLTEQNLEQRRNRFWIKGDPDAVLLIELTAEHHGDLRVRQHDLVHSYRCRSLGYAFPAFRSPELERVWDLRRASLGLLMGMLGRRKAVTGIEDTAVPVSELAAYVRDIQRLMRLHGTSCVVYGSASMGLLHLRPQLDLKASADRATFEILLQEVAALVARYGGSFSGKHGDGRLRGRYLANTLRPEIVELLREIKLTFDPQDLLNPGAIFDSARTAPQMRGAGGAGVKSTNATYFDWGKTAGLLGAAESCHGAGACLKHAGRGTMCPSYMATHEEIHGTRGRANLFRQVLMNSRDGLSSEELYKALDLCLSCKACHSECPANVDMARMKAEFLQHYHDKHGIPWRARVLRYYTTLSRMASHAPALFNVLLGSRKLKEALGIYPGRQLPRLAMRRFSAWFKAHRSAAPADNNGIVALLNDPIIEYYEPELGQAAVEVLERTGFTVRLTRCLSSGRVEISQGLLRRARITLRRALSELYTYASEDIPIVGLEPSEILTFRDEPRDLIADGPLREKACAVARKVFVFEEFIQKLVGDRGIDPQIFDHSARKVLLHVHCHQKAFSGLKPSIAALESIPNVQVQSIPSGCCGMAGAFGYEVEHYALSQRIGELVLFPAVRMAGPDTIVIATGTSCRVQIMEGTGVKAWHPAQIMRAALR